MTAERWQRVKAIFHAAVETDPEARAEFLRESCGNDEELRNEVESLLAADRDAGSLIDHPLLAPTPVADAAPVTQVLKDRYELERQLGRGGMGVVYLARDRQLLAKHVVVKVLLEETGQDSWVRQKFQQEIEALARIEHPGVVSVLDSGFTPEGKQFLVMQYIEGVSLRSAIDPGGMDPQRAAGIIRQIGQALEAAHDRGVLHRDLKPENVMLQRLGGDDHVKLIDFGIAGIRNSQFAGEKSKVAGSLHYMAPEQVAGQACAASDTYALAVVAYEILTGSLPAPGQGSRAELPAAAEKSIRRALLFRPELRQSSVREFSEELYSALGGSTLATAEAGNRQEPRRLGAASALNLRSKTLLAAALVLIALAAGGAFWFTRGRIPSPPEQPSIAVLPFEDMSPGKDQEYLSEGIAEQLLNSLASIPELRVAGRRSSFRFKGTSEDPRAIGKALNVRSILEGSVSRQGNQARINVRLIKVSDGFSLWSNSYNPEMTDIFAAQDAIANAVTEALKVKLLGNRAPGPTAKSANVEAYKAYLQGRYFLARSSKESRAKAVSYFEEATRMDPLYAPAWAGLGDARIGQASASDIEQGYELARASVGRALKLDPNLGEAHAAMGEIQMLNDWDWNGADASFQLALALKPGDARVLRSKGSLERILGHLDESIRLYRRAVEIEPLSGNSNLGLALHYAGRQEEAKAALGKALEVTPEIEVTHTTLSRVYLAESRLPEALAEAQKEKPLVWRLYGLGLVYFALGRMQEADASLAELIAKFPKDAQYLIAGVCAYRGEADRAFEWLERAYKERDPGLTEMRADPLLKSLRTDPRYIALLGRVGLPPVKASE